MVDSHYWCDTQACRNRQASYAIAAYNSDGDMEYIYVPLPKQVEIEEEASIVIRGGRPHKILAGGAAGPGKSTGGRNILYRRCMMIPGFEALILRESFPELKRSHMRRMDEEAVIFKSRGVAVEWTPSNFIMRFPNGSLIELGHMEDEAAVRKYLSTEYDAIMADEAVLYPPKALMELIGRARSSKQAVRDSGGPLVLLPSNPGGPSAAVLRSLCIDKEPNLEEYPQLEKMYHVDEFAYIPSNIEDNPYLDEDYEADLALNQPWRYQQLRFNDWDIIAGQFFDSFRPNPTDTGAEIVDWTHVADLGDIGEPEWFRSMDWGYTSPGCVLWWACLPDSVYYIRHEWKYSHMVIEEVVSSIVDKTEDWGIHPSLIRYTEADPSMKGVGQEARGERMTETFARCGVSLIMGDNDRKSGWQRIREMFRKREDGRPHVIIHPECRYLIRTLSNAVAAKNDPEDVNTRIDDHALDAMRYGAMSRPSPTRLRKAGNSNSFYGHQRRTLNFRRRMSVR
jgi:hypothetical protein